MENTAKNFALQLGSLISLYVSIGALITLLFSIITVLHPDQAQYAWEYEGATSSIRSSIAVLIVFFPTYILLTRMVNVIRRTESGAYLTLTKWLIYISLLIGGGVILGDLVTVLNSFLNGELTIRFVLKALVVLLVVGLAFAYYLADVRGYWQAHEKNSIRYGIGVSLCIIVAIVFGFTKTETPTQVRDMNIDRTQVSDLQNIQSRVESYTILNEKLPATIEDAFGGLSVPTASENRDPYTYQAIGADTFTLCAEFKFPTSESERSYGYSEPMVAEKMMIKNPYSWDHNAGAWCFERVVNTTERTQ